MRAVLAIPGDLASPTGGYGYARRLVRGAPAVGVELEVLPLGDGFPTPAADVLAAAGAALAAVPPEVPLLIDGLAYGALPASVTRAIRGPVVALCHHPLALEAGLSPATVAGLAATEQAALERAAHVITTSRATARIVETDYRVAPGRLTVARPGTDPAPRAPGSGGPGCRIISVGSVTPRKGHRRLVRALAEWRQFDWTLRIIGPTPDPVALEELHATIAATELQGRISIAGALTMTAVTAAYQTADLFALASEYEGFGMAFAEAMSHGLPVLGLTSAAVAEATRDAATLVEPEDLVDALGELIRDADARTKLADACWAAAADLPRWDETVAIVARVLRAQA